MWYADNVKTAPEMHNWLVARLFPTCKSAIKENFADKWQVDTQNGLEYLRQHGLHVLCKAAQHVRTGKVSTCSVISQDMRADILGAPVAEYLRCKLLDVCCNADNVDYQMYHNALRHKVFTQQSLNLAYPEATPEKPVAAPTEDNRNATSTSLPASPPTKRKRGAKS